MASTMVKALLNTLMGMGTVFLVLIFISLVISLFRYIPAILTRMDNRRRKREEALRLARSQIMPQRPAPKRPELPAEADDGYDGPDEQEELVYDEELVAVITAALLTYLGEAVSADKLVVRSIRRVKTRNRR